MDSERRLSPRYPFFASAQVTELQTGVRLVGRTSELSKEGCYFDMMNPLSSGTVVKIQITNQQQTFEAKGHVIYSQSNKGMGVFFDEVGTEHRLILDKWLSASPGS